MLKILACMAGLVLVLAGCAHYSTPLLDKDFEGIAAASSDARNVRVLFVHGIGEHQPGYANGLVDQLARRLELQALGEPETRTIRYPGIQADAAVVRVWRYARAGGQQVRLYELTWSPLTTPIKQSLLGYDREPVYKPHRATINKLLKEDLIDWKLSDAILYLGEFRKPMQWAVIQGLCHALNDLHYGDGPCSMTNVDVPGLERDQIVFVSASLGSRMLFDALESLRKEAQTQELADAIVARTNLFFMMANQLPLLQLGRIEKPIGPPRPGALVEPDASRDALSDFVDSWSRIQAERRRLFQTPENAAQRRLQIVAFSDPNDLLSFTIPDDAAYIRPGVQFANVIVSNVGEVLGLFAQPDKAHTGYDENPAVWDLMICGAKDLHANCMPKSR